jgi:hypothetical protein
MSRIIFTLNRRAILTSFKSALQSVGYPAEPHCRKHGPCGYNDYESYRDWLRDEFSYRCVFSLMRETWPQVRFHIDHLISQKERPDLVCDYDNLILLEGRLNIRKEGLDQSGYHLRSIGKVLQWY